MPVFRLLEPRRCEGARLDVIARAVGLELDGRGDVVAGSVTVSHREVRAEALFAALPGRRMHGADFAVQAAAAGAVAVLTDEAGSAAARASGLPVLLAADPRAALGSVAAAVYGTDRARPTLLGVTGTNGKTSTVHLLDAILRRLGVPSGYSSTAERRSAEHVVASRLTSPEAPELHALLARMTEDGVETAAIEVSAQALVRSRVEGLVFDVAGFTNLSHDHLDDFGDLSTYLRAKQRLFRPDRSRRGVVVVDTAAGRTVAAEAEVPVVTVGTRDADWTVDVLSSTATGTRLRLVAPDGWSMTTAVPLIGRHMASNAALAIVMLVEAGYSRSAIAAALASGLAVSVPGRTLLVSGAEGPRLYVDFSHTPDSVARTVDALREVTPGRVLVILGADGDRDPSKRAPMGRAAADRADLVIVTDHHPRFEDPAQIRRALLEGALGRGCEVREVAEPARAVRAALGDARADDSILWVGPGDTDYRVVLGADLPYSPRADAALALAEAGWAV
ncbi:Mur ligase family protein [Rathayibacter sp. VKM Ac-2754]|uniref:Mur ligase family protein n=1 Tax=Rathayibacter sp. VKM Ac-2754 TaxID=2609251 RepID=UPI001F1FE892|nr:UDP-N-acetylmuramoyl-L-alanyl-D-glutamate--2,6-diaminopimelate ligase [Rathayibacter sp. VKM Ac-2754]